MTINPLTGFDDDAARRLSDTYNLVLQADFEHACGKYLAVRLRDGHTEETLYDTRRDAIRHTTNLPDAYEMVQVIPAGMSYQAAGRWIIAQRKLHNTGFRMPHPEDSDVEREVHLPQRIEQWAPSGLILPEQLRGPRRLTIPNPNFDPRRPRP